MKASCSCRDLLLYSICRQNAAEEKSNCLSARFVFQSMYSPQRKLSPFLERNRGTNVDDSRGLNLERRCFVADCNNQPSICNYVCLHIVVVISFRNGPWSCCLFISGGLFISWLTRCHVPETAVTQALAV